MTNPDARSEVEGEAAKQERPPNEQGPSVGRSVNTTYFAANPRVLIAWPDEGTLDTGPTASENIDFQMEYFSRLGQPGIVVIYFDRLQGQDRGARKVYSARTEKSWALGIVLVGGSLLTRALGSFFMGLSRPVVPIRMFETLEDASGWIDELLGAEG